MSGPTVGALFAGYGGLELAVRELWPDAGTAWVSEFDAAPSRILARRFPGVPNLGDVTKIDWAAVEPVDIITGGSPCQDLSHAGKRAGMKAGTRSGLWASMCDAIDIIRPRLVVWENVRGALSAEATAGDVESCEFCVGDDGSPSLRALGRVLGDLAELGYDAAWTGLRAADVGAPHGRFRVFVLAWPATDADLFGTQQNGRGIEAPDNARRDLPQGQRGPNIDDPLPAWGSREWRDLTLLPTPAVNDMGAGKSLEWWDEWAPRQKSADGRPAPHGKSLHVEALRLLPTPRAQAREHIYAREDHHNNLEEILGYLHEGLNPHPPKESKLPSAVQLLPTPRANEPGSTGTGYGLSLNEAVGASKNGRNQEWREYGPAIARWEAVLGRPAPDPTEPTGRDGTHRLSPRFVEFMMGLPSGWVTDPAIWEGMKPSAARNAQLKALGNGVVPQQGAAAVRHLLAIATHASEAAA